MDIKTAIYRYCNYQERSHKEVRDKLYELGANTTEVNELVAVLIEEDLLNEERFAKAFVRGRFRLKHWGRIKILQHLKRHNISAYLLGKAIKEIDPAEYFATLTRLAARKWENLKDDRDNYKRRGKVYSYLQQKGYESSVIKEVIQELGSME
jgi:regulatory protein